VNSVPKEITVEMLRDWNACREGVAAFRRVFGQSAAFVPGNVYRMADDRTLRGSTWWLFERLSSEDEHKEVSRQQAANCPMIRGIGTCTCVMITAGALCRLARQNLPKKKARQS